MMRTSSSSDETPGKGWSNGDVHPQMFPETRDGKLQLYSAQRRWIHLAHGWSRIGGGGGDSNNDDGASPSPTDEYSHRTSSSKMGESIHDARAPDGGDGEARSVRSLIAQLCEQFYRNGWATGTGGGVTIRVGGPPEGRPWRVFVAPSGIQKEDMIGDDVFELDMDRQVVVPPRTTGLRQSACTPLWYVVFRNRPTARSVIHTHSMHAVLATLLDPTETATSLHVTHLEMIKGVGHHAYDDTLVVPIIDNRPSEDMLADQLEAAIKKHPKCNCVLVRRHGLYVWGDSWEQAKTQCESFDYLFQTAVEMKKLGLDCGVVPQHGSYRDGEDNGGSGTGDRGCPPAAKRHKANNSNNGPTPTADPTTADGTASSSEGWKGVALVDNAQDLAANSVPILPRDCRHLLLDVEGCTTAISFVKDTLFPYVLEHIDAYLAALPPDECDALAGALRKDLTPEQGRQCVRDGADGGSADNCASMVRYMVSHDLKLASLKALQGQMWRGGYEGGTLRGHVYPDLMPTLQWMRSAGVRVYIYSSGSVQAQRLLFGHSLDGDLLPLLDGHYDIPTAGNKHEAASYAAICDHIGIPASDLVFCSDSEAELEAAKNAGVGHAVMTVRPGNAPLTAGGRGAYPQAFSLLQLCGT